MAHQKKNSVWFAQNLVLMIVGAVLVWSVLSGQIFWYVRPDYHFFTLIMGVLALFLCNLGFWFPPQHSHHEVSASRMNVLMTTAVVILLSTYLVFFHRSSLSPRAANNRGLNQNAVTGSKSVFALSSDLSPLLEAGDSEQYSLADWIRLFKINPDPWSHKGKPVRVTGFVTPVDDQSFYLSRFVISCCTVDASPIGLLVRSSQNFIEGEWLEVAGVIETAEIDGVAKSIIIPREIKKITEPEQPYLY